MKKKPTKDYDELDELLEGIEPSKPKPRFSNPEVVKQATKGNAVPRPKAMSVPRIIQTGPVITFLTKKGQRIIGPADKYYVVRLNGKLHYKEESGVTFLPEGWKEGDPLPD